MNNSDNLNMDLDDYRNELVTQLLNQIFMIAARDEEDYGLEFADRMLLTFLQSYITAMVSSALMSADDRAGLSPYQKAELSIKRYSQMKQMIQTAVGAAFTKAFEVSGVNKDYPDFITVITPIDTENQSVYNN